MLIRSVAPKLNFNSTINKLPYNTYQLANSCPLYAIEDKNQAVVGVEIIYGAGKNNEIKKGASYFSSSLLKAGISGFNSNDINEFFELRGAFVQVQSALDYNSLSLYCLSEKLDEALPFFLKLFTQPIFPQDQLDKLVKKKYQELEINEQKSNYWAAKLLKKALFKNHPYGHVLDKQELSSITQEDLSEHWKNYSSNNIQFITATGNINLNDLINKIEDTIDPQATEKNSIKDIFKPSHNSSSEKKKLPNNGQSSLKIGIHSIALTSPEYPSLSFGNTLLGGYFGSRLMQSIREDKGLTYGISSSIVHLKEASYIQISADVKIGAGSEVIDLIKIELENLTNSAIAEQELDKVKSYLIGEYKSNSETIFDKMSKVKFLKLQNLPDAYYIDHFNAILNLDAQKIQEVLRNFFKAESFNTVLVE